jgi:peroxiredoxin
MIETNENAVDLNVLLSDGSECQLGDFWKKAPVVLVFLRHFG